jgi:hypothetical protein
LPLGSILATVAAYVVVALLLLSLNLTSRWQWWIKGTAIGVTGLFFVGSYFAIVSMLGWPSEARPPARFSVIATRVVEPNAFTGDPGAIYLWLEALDENNVVSGQPRSFKLVYTEPLADAAADVQDMLNAGEEVQGEVNEQEQQEENQAEEGEGGDPGVQGQGGGYYPVEFTLIFNDLPPVVLPDKGAL